MKNWKTSLMGILVGLSGFFKHSPDPKWQSLGDTLMQISVALGFWFAADNSHPALQTAPAAASPQDKRQSNLPGLVPLFLIGGLLFFGSGCAGAAACIRAAGKDASPATLQIRSIYATVVYTRGGASTNSVEISDTGNLKQNR